MKILYLITHPFLGGAQKYVLELSKNLKDKAKIWLGTGQDGWLVNELRKENISVVFFKNLKRSFNPFKNLFLIFEVKKFLDKNKFDIIHLNSSNALLAAIGAKLTKNKPKIVFTLHGLSILHSNWQKSWLVKSIYYLVLKLSLYFVDKIIFVCQHDLDFALKIKLIKKNKCFLIYNGLKSPEFLEKDLAKKFIEKTINQPLNNKIIIGTISRLEYSKNIENLLESAKILKRENIIYLVIGDGPERKKIEKLINRYQLKNNFFLLGDIPEAAKYLKAFDIFVLPSRYEGFPLVILEAMNARLPIVVTDVGGLKEMIENKKEGILVEAKNPKVLAMAIKELIENKNLARNLAENAYRKVKEMFSLEKMVKETFNLYQEI
jgi:glycosyltransferase involved in cell wall biosynthesis